MFQVHKDRKQAFEELRVVVAEIRQKAKEKGIHKLSTKDINRAVAAARRRIGHNRHRLCAHQP